MQVQGRSHNVTSTTALNALPPFVMADMPSAIQYNFSDPTREPIEMTLKAPYSKDSLSSELLLEASLHVSTFQAIACEAQFRTQPSFGFPLLAQAPSLKMGEAMSSELSNADRIDFGTGGQIQSLAACLATPIEPPASPAQANTVGRAVLESEGVRDEVQSVVNKWSDWVRRIRRRRRLESIASLISTRITNQSADDSPIKI